MSYFTLIALNHFIVGWLYEEFRHTEQIKQFYDFKTQWGQMKQTAAMIKNHAEHQEAPVLTSLGRI